MTILCLQDPNSSQRPYFQTPSHREVDFNLWNKLGGTHNFSPSQATVTNSGSIEGHIKCCSYVDLAVKPLFIKIHLLKYKGKSRFIYFTVIFKFYFKGIFKYINIISKFINSYLINLMDWSIRLKSIILRK